MNVYLLTIFATLYLIGFFAPLLLQVIIENINKRKNISFFKYLMSINFIKSVILSYKKENVLKSLSNSCFTMGILSIFLSNISMLTFSDSTSNQLFSLFLGLWAPTLICVGVFLRK